MGRRVLVTGASGFIGQALCHRLLEAGAAVTGVAHQRPLPDGVPGEAIDLVEGIGAVVAALHPDVLIHLAAPVVLDRDPALYPRLRRGLLDSTEAVARACLARDVRLLHVGTCEEYGDGAAPFHEAQAARPVSPYSALKAAASAYVGMLGRVAGLRATIVRPFRTYGPGDRSSVVAAACRAALAGQPLPLTDGAQIREWNHVDGMVVGLMAAAAHPGAVGRLLNLGGGPRAAVRDLVARVFALAGADPGLLRVGALPRRPGEVDRFWGDHSAAEALFGPLPQPSLDEGLRDCLDWWAQQPQESA